MPFIQHCLFGCSPPRVCASLQAVCRPSKQTGACRCRCDVCSLRMLTTSPLLCSASNKWRNCASFPKCFDLIPEANRWGVNTLSCHQTSYMCCVCVLRPALSPLDAVGKQRGEPPAAADAFLPGSQPQCHESLWRANR